MHIQIKNKFWERGMKEATLEPPPAPVRQASQAKISSGVDHCDSGMTETPL